MSIPAYPEYKNSGFEWLSEVPSHWQVNRLDRLMSFASGRAHEPYLAETGDHVYISARFVSTQGKSLKLCTEKLTPAFRGEIVMVMSDLPNGRALARAYQISDDRSYAVNQRVCRLNEFLGSSRYYYYQLDRNPGLLRYDDGTNQTHLSNSAYCKLALCCPPQIEQAAIATFLDRETAKIDALVTEQERLIALLKEKRQAEISHAVTKGLNPNATMKDSGIEWLGEIPAHWDLVKAVRFFRASKGKEGQLLTKEYCADNAGEYPVFSGQTESNGVMGMLDRYEFDAGDEGYLFSTTVGAKAMTVSHIFGKFSLSQNCMIIRPVNETTAARFYFYHFQPVFGYQRSLIPDHMQPSFRMEDLYSFSIARPPKIEQLEIANYLDTVLVGYRALEVEAQSAITLLQERRAALISTAVTGKIDVRGLAVAPAELEHA